jgi:predicted metal-dependent HD superfamily phosphohydrolase
MFERPPPLPERRFTSLLEAYAQPRRHYHGLAHIEAMLMGLQQCRRLLHDPEAVELAVWFHDAVYDARAGDNEESSAVLARDALKERVEPVRLAKIEAFILATKRHELAGTSCEDDRSDLAHFLDLDLQILGAPANQFDAYEAAVRLEYAHVEDAAWRLGRAAVLQRFAARPGLYFSPFFAERLDRQARDNLTRSLARLAARG